jgi:hypothetical protein
MLVDVPQSNSILNPVLVSFVLDQGEDLIKESYRVEEHF